jgi:hypothetical protein
MTAPETTRREVFFTSSLRLSVRSARRSTAWAIPSGGFSKSTLSSEPPTAPRIFLASFSTRSSFLKSSGPSVRLDSNAARSWPPSLAASSARSRISSCASSRRLIRARSIISASGEPRLLLCRPCAPGVAAEAFAAGPGRGVCAPTSQEETAPQKRKIDRRFLRVMEVNGVGNERDRRTGRAPEFSTVTVSTRRIQTRGGRMTVVSPVGRRRFG